MKNWRRRRLATPGLLLLFANQSCVHGFCAPTRPLTQNVRSGGAYLVRHAASGGLLSGRKRARAVPFSPLHSSSRSVGAQEDSLGEAESADFQAGEAAAAAAAAEGGQGFPLVPLVLLNVVTVLWGTQHSVIKLLISDDSLAPGAANFARFLLAALLFSPWTPGLLESPPTLPFAGDISGKAPRGGEVSAAAAPADVWRAGAELGCWMFAGFMFQTIGLEYTTASRSAFLLYLNVKLVPFFAFAIFGKTISLNTWLSCLAAFVGTVLLSYDGSPPNVGDVLSMLAAASSAMFIIRLETYAKSIDNALALNSANLWITAGLCGLWCAGTQPWDDPHTAADTIRALQAGAPLLAYLAFVTTALTNWLQAIGQKAVPAEQAAVIYCLDPVYAAIFARVVLDERLGPQGLLGAAIVTSAALWSQYSLLSESESEGEDLGPRRLEE